MPPSVTARQRFWLSLGVNGISCQSPSFLFWVSSLQSALNNSRWRLFSIVTTLRITCDDHTFSWSRVILLISPYHHHWWLCSHCSVLYSGASFMSRPFANRHLILLFIGHVLIIEFTIIHWVYSHLFLFNPKQNCFISGYMLRCYQFPTAWNINVMKFIYQPFVHTQNSPICEFHIHTWYVYMNVSSASEYPYVRISGRAFI